MLTLSHALISAGIEVTTMSSLRMAEQALQQHEFDLVIADIRTSSRVDIGRLELLSYVRRCWPKTQVIVLAESGSETVQNEAYERGAHCCYEIPVDIAALIAYLREKGIVSPVEEYPEEENRRKRAAGLSIQEVRKC